MFHKQIYCSHDAAKKYGLASAILLQALHNLGATKDWKKESIIVAGCDWWQPATIKRMVTNLETEGVLTTTMFGNDRSIRVGGIKNTQSKKTEPAQTPLLGITKPKKKVKRKLSPVQEMNAVIRAVTKSPDTVSYARYLPFCKKLIKAGYSHEQVEKWYGEGGWWYTSYWKGQRDYIPKQLDISETLEMAKENKQDEKGAIKRKSLWER